jgi:hypothetical protein
MLYQRHHTVRECKFTSKISPVYDVWEVNLICSLGFILHLMT